MCILYYISAVCFLVCLVSVGHLHCPRDLCPSCPCTVPVSWLWVRSLSVGCSWSLVMPACCCPEVAYVCCIYYIYECYINWTLLMLYIIYIFVIVCLCCGLSVPCLSVCLSVSCLFVSLLVAGLFCVFLDACRIIYWRLLFVMYAVMHYLLLL